MCTKRTRPWIGSCSIRQSWFEHRIANSKTCYHGFNWRKIASSFVLGLIVSIDRLPGWFSFCICGQLVLYHFVENVINVSTFPPSQSCEGDNTRKQMTESTNWYWSFWTTWNRRTNWAAAWENIFFKNTLRVWQSIFNLKQFYGCPISRL